MRNAMREYIDLTEDEKRDLWDNATFVFDTNVFLNLYRYSRKTREVLLKAMRDFGDRVWIPHQVAHEYLKNRAEAIHDTSQRYDSLAEDFFQECRKKLRIKDDEADFRKLKAYVTDWIEKHKKENVTASLSCDPILDEILALFDGRVGDPYDSTRIEEIKKDGASRYARKVPPGYMDGTKAKANDDNNAYGDLFVWFQILDYAAKESRNIVFITHDQKEDWWAKLHGKTIGPRYELRKEFLDRTGGKLCFHMYSMESFISYYVGATDKGVVDEVKAYSVDSNPVIMRNGKHYVWRFLNEKGGMVVSNKGHSIHDLAMMRHRQDYLRHRIAMIESEYAGRDLPSDIKDTLYELKMKDMQLSYDIERLSRPSEFSGHVD